MTISSRGMGSVKEVMGEGETLEVQPDFELIAFDFVSNPSTHGAFLSPVNESKGKPKENQRTTKGKPNENQRKTKGKPKENQRKTKGKPKENQRKTKGKQTENKMKTK